MLGLTSIDLPFLGNLRSNWVVVIGLELLSLACPGLDLGSVMLHYFVTLVTVMVMLILLVWRIGFGVTGMEFVGVGVMPTVQGSVRCDAGSLWIVIIPKSKDPFMERPPMKTVQP
jgi:small-conductance mechanosensitive channel